MNVIGIIPARYASSRFPGKPLADIAGKSMIQRVVEQASKSDFLTKVVVATDDERIFSHVKAFGGEAIITRENHQSGTDRCFEAVKKTEGDFDLVVNIQGDEPFINPQQIDQLVNLFQTDKIEIGTLGKRITDDDEIQNENTVKVAFDIYGKALYFSRATIPFPRNEEQGKYFKHLGLYAYRTKVLETLTSLTPSTLEKTESLEQLRWLENGHSIHVAETQIESRGIDTPDDLEKALKWLKTKEFNI